jgi:molecular chaperone GrpE
MNEEIKDEMNTNENSNETPEQEPELDENNSNNQKIEELEKERDAWKDKFLRKAAEFENYKKRVENDQLALVTYAAESFIKKILPVVDDFERSLQHINDAQDIENIKKGIELIYNKLIKFLEEQGVTKIDSVGKPFDVHFHEAVMQREDESVPPHTVLDELEKGYMLKDKVIRFAKVVVSSDN